MTQAAQTLSSAGSWHTHTGHRRTESGLMRRTPKQSEREKLDAVRLHLQQKEWGRAAQILAPLVAKARPEAEALFYMGAVHEAAQRFDLAQQFAERSMRAQPSPMAALLLARAHRMRGRTEEALRLCDRALGLSPGNGQALETKAGALEEAGRFDEARAILGPMIEEARRRGREPSLPVLIGWSKLLVQQKRYGEAVSLIDRLLAADEIGEQNRCALGYLKAKACDRAREYRGAFHAAKGANAIGELDFDPALYAEQVEVLMEHWSREKMAGFPLSTCRSAVPIFVAGMPRSGTSLIDQIIDAHPKAAGVGELATIDGFARQLAQAWRPDLDAPDSFGPLDSRRWTQVAERYEREIRRLAPGAERIVNKSLGNNRLVGLIARLFPNTRIIHAIRDPRDVAISCFMGGFNNALHPWTTRLEWVAAAWEQSMRMMDHWKATLDVPILDVHYEKLVSDPETEFPRIIEFLGLEWDDACREFHKSRRTVRTLSYDQVNRPLYTTSAGRHQHYAEFLGGVRFPEYSAR